MTSHRNTPGEATLDTLEDGNTNSRASVKISSASASSSTDYGKKGAHGGDVIYTRAQLVKASVCFAGLQISYIAWGVVQEQLMTQEYGGKKFTSSSFCVFGNRFFALIVALVIVVYQKYTDRISKLYTESKNDLYFEIRKIFSKNLTNEILNLIKEKDWLGLENISSKIRKSFYFSAFINNPLNSLSNVIELIFALNKKPKGIFVSFVGEESLFSALIDDFISLAIKWHIFIPPNRVLVNSESTSFLKDVNEIINSGGVVISINKSSLLTKKNLQYISKFIEIEVKEETTFYFRKTNKNKVFNNFTVNAHNLWLEILNFL